MNRAWTGWFLIVMVVVAVSSGCVVVTSHPEDAPEGPGMQDQFSKVRAGMSSAEVEGILGPPRQVLIEEDDASQRIHVWETGWLFFSRDTALVKFKDDRVVIASYSSGRIGDPAAWVEDIERRSAEDGSPGKIREVVRIPGALLSEDQPWAELSSILVKLDRSWGAEPPADVDVVTVFDSITASTDLESILARIGPPSTTRTEPTSLTHVWDLRSNHLTVRFEQGTVMAKQLDTPNLEIVVKERYWQARDKRRGSTVTEYL